MDKRSVVTHGPPDVRHLTASPLHDLEGFTQVPSGAGGVHQCWKGMAKEIGWDSRWIHASSLSDRGSELHLSDDLLWPPFPQRDGTLAYFRSPDMDGRATGEDSMGRSTGCGLTGPRIAPPGMGVLGSSPSQAEGRASSLGTQPDHRWDRNPFDPFGSWRCTRGGLSLGEIRRDRAAEVLTSPARHHLDGTDPGPGAVGSAQGQP